MDGWIKSSFADFVPELFSLPPLRQKKAQGWGTHGNSQSG
jgi:hypothetical protein